MILSKPSFFNYHHLFFNILCLLVILATLLLLSSEYYLFAMVPALGLVTLLFLTIYPEAGLFIVVFLIPFGAYRSFGEIKITWVISLWLLVILCGRLLLKAQYIKYLSSNLWRLLLMFLIFNLVSNMFSQYEAIAFSNLFKFVVAFLFITLCLGFFTHKKLFFETLPKLLIWSISLCALAGLLGHFFNVSYFQNSSETFKRSTGVTQDANNFSLMIVFSLPFIFHWMKSTKNRLFKVIAFTIILCNVIAVFVSYSRGGLILMTLLLFILIYYHYIRQINAKSLGSMFALIILVTVTAFSLMKTNDLYSKRLQNITNTQQDKAIGRRFTYLIVGWEAFKKAPLLGHGTGSFREIYSKTKYAAKYDKEGKTLKRYAHNTYLEILVGTGIIGLTLFLLILRRAFKNFWAAAKSFKRQNKINESEVIYAYIFSFASISLYLLIFSDIYHKYILLSIALSQIALNLSQQQSNENR